MSLKEMQPKASRAVQCNGKTPEGGTVTVYASLIADTFTEQVIGSLSTFSKAWGSNPLRCKTLGLLLKVLHPYLNRL